jgi:hypothetical protein
MATITQVSGQTSTLVNSLAKNLATRMYFYQLDAGRYLAQGMAMTRAYAQQANKLRRAYYALRDEAGEQHAKQVWARAHRDTIEQFIQRNLGCTVHITPYHLSDGTDSRDHWSEQVPRPAENDFYEAFPEWERREEHDYDGTDTFADIREDNELLGWQPSVTRAEHDRELAMLIGSKSDRYFRMAAMADTIVTATGIDNGFFDNTWRARIAIERMHHNGKNGWFSDPDLGAKMSQALEWFNNAPADIIEDPAELWQMRGRNEITFSEHYSTLRPMDLSIGIEDSSHRMQRVATAGIGTNDFIQKFHQMSPEYFYAFFRNRRHTTDAGSPAIPETPLQHLIKATIYKRNEEGKMQVMPHAHVDNFIRSLCLARWHDEVHGTDFYEQAKARLRAAFDYADTLIDLAEGAIAEAPHQGDQRMIALFIKEENQMRKHNWGYFHHQAATA